MMEHRKIEIGGRTVEALAFSLTGKNLIVLRGSRGYVMCGYLNLEAAEKFGDAAVKITGVSTIDDALKASVAACTSRAKALGIADGQPVKKALELLA